jgi:serine beta-lactamase-like protein LACTB, mitochondrial
MVVRSRIRNLLGIPLLLFAAARAFAKDRVALPAETIPRVEAAIVSAMSEKNVPGLSVAVVLERRLAWSRGYGFADLENCVPFRATTVNRLASVSKPITAVAAMQLSERGRLDLDAPIQRYCPAFPKKPEPITTRQLIGHLSGIRHYASGENFNSTRHYESVTESLEAFAADPLLQEPGTKYTYSTYGYVVLGCVIEGASGVKYADYVRENIAKPAGMEQTRPDDVDAIIAGRARPYAKLPDGEPRNADLADTSNKVPGGGMVSTAEDLARFAIALETNKLLQPATFAQMLVPLKTRDGVESPYFGWTIAERSAEKVLTHSGSQQGTNTYLLMVPSRGFALALLTNTEDAGLRSLARQLTDILLP